MLFLRELINKLKNDIINLFNNLSIRSKLILIYMLIIIIPFVFISFFSFTKYVKYIQDKVTDSKMQTIAQISNNLDNYMEEIEKLSLITYSNKGIQEALKKGLYTNIYDDKNSSRELTRQEIISNNRTITNYFIDLMSPRMDLLGAYIFCENNQVYKISRGEYISSLYDFKKDNWYKLALSSEGKSLIFTSNILNKYFTYKSRVITFCKAIRDPSNFKNLGVIVIALDVEKIKNLCSGYGLNDDSRILISNSDGRVIYYGNENLIDRVVVNNFFMDVLYRSSGSFISDIKGERYVVFFNTSKYTGWKVVEIVSLGSLYKEIYNLRTLINLGMILCVILMVFISIYLSLQLTRPIKNLTKAMESIRDDNLDIKVEIDSNDEIGRLSKSFNAMIIRIKSLIDNVYTAQIKRKEAELNALQNQINPHFLYNTLEMIGNIAEIENVPQISSITKSLGRMFRYSIKSEKEVVSIKEEINHSKNYLNIQQLRFDNRFEVVFDTDDDVKDCKILKLLMQPIIENAIFHGLEKKVGKGVVVVTAKRINEDEIEMAVTDNGIGIDDDTLCLINKSLKANINYLGEEGNNTRGFALVNVNSRINLFFGEKYGLRIETQKNRGTKVIIHIPVLKEVK